MKLFTCDCRDRWEALGQRLDRLEASRKAQAQDFAELQDKVYRWMKRSDQRVQAAHKEVPDDSGGDGGHALAPPGLSGAALRIWLRRHKRGVTNGLPTGLSSEG